MLPVLAALIAFLAPGQAAPKGPPTQPILRIEAGGHTAAVRSIVADPKGRFVATGSYDKSVRIWELPSLRLIRVLRPPLGTTMDEGKIYALALSPDGTTLAVGGSTGWEWDDKGSVYLFAVESGRLVGRIGRLPNIVVSLAFSPDGHRLAVGFGGDNGLRVVSASDGSLAFEDKGYRDDIYGLSYAPDGRLATCSGDRTVRLYDAIGKAIASVERPKGSRPMGIAFSPDGSRLVVGDAGRPDVSVFDGQDLSYLFSADTADLVEHVARVCWSADGASLYASGRASMAGGNEILRRWTAGGRGKPVDVGIARNTVYRLAPLPDGGISFATYEGLGVLRPNGSVQAVVNSMADLRDLGTQFRLTRDGGGCDLATDNLVKNQSPFRLQRAP